MADLPNVHSDKKRRLNSVATQLRKFESMEYRKSMLALKVSPENKENENVDKKGNGRIVRFPFPFAYIISLNMKVILTN